MIYVLYLYDHGFRIEDKNDLVAVLKPVVAATWIPCLFGILLWISTLQIGYEPTLLKFYGTSAVPGDAPIADGVRFHRIPSTFFFATQYVWYTIAMIIPSFMLTRLLPLSKWRHFATLTMGLAAFASFLSGARAAVISVPAMLGLIYWLEGRAKNLEKPAAICASVLLAVFLTAALAPSFLFCLNGSFSIGFLKGSIIPNFFYAVQKAPLGFGAGAATDATFHAFEALGTEQILFSESLCTRAVLELGIPGLVVLLALFLLILKYGYSFHMQIRDSSLKGCSSAILAFITLVALTGIKGSAVDIDPINVYFWIFTGFLLKLRALDEQYTNEST